MKKLKGIAFVCAVLFAVAVIHAPLSNAFAEESFSYSTYAETYQFETGIVQPPALVLSVQSENDLQTLSATKTPTVALFRADENGDAVDKTGAPLLSFDAAVRTCNHAVIPAFVFETSAEMEAVYEYINEKNLLDAMVFSSDYTLVSTFKSKRSNIQGGVIFSDADLTDGETRSEIRAEVNRAMGMIALINGGKADKAAVEELQALGLTCWITIGESVYDVYYALYTGVNGLVTQAVELAISVMESITEPTMIRKVFLSGHRGELTYGENVVVGANYAYLCGADYVELDLMRTKDNRLIVMHDDTIKRTTTYNGNLRISEMTLEEVRQYKVRGMQLEEIPVIEDYLEYLTIRPDMKLLVELKTDDALVPVLLNEVLNDYDVDDQIIVISAYKSALQSLRALRPHLSMNFLGYYTTLSTLCESLYSQNCSFGPGISYIKDESIYTAARVRGIPQYTWTFSDIATFEHYMYLNTSLTSDFSAYASDQAIGLSVGTERSYTVTHTTELSVCGTQTLRKRVSAFSSERVVQSAPVILHSGIGSDDVASYSDGKLTLGTSTGEGVYYFTSRWESSATDHYYYVMSEPFQVSASLTENVKPEVPPQSEQPSDNAEKPKSKAGLIVGILCGAVVLAATVVAVVIVRKKKKKGQ